MRTVRVLDVSCDKAMITERQRQVLNIIVGEYIGGGLPVSSENVASRLPRTVSPATVRNDMAELEVSGYITRPYTSAGGVPSDGAYRSYVESLGANLELDRDLQNEMRRKVQGVRRNVEDWPRMAANMLARLVRCIAVATPPRAIETRWKHIELVYLQEFLALLVMVLEETRLKQQLIPLKVPVTQDDLAKTSNRLNSYFRGLTRNQVSGHNAGLTSFEDSVTQAALDILVDEERQELAEPYVDGLRHIVHHPDLVGSSHALGLAELLEDRSQLQSIFNDIPAEGVVHVAIGSENKTDLLRPFSVVVTRYGIPEEATGVVGIVGPTRMEYASAISNVRYLSYLMSELVSEVHGTHHRPIVG
jgi:heat-inducible transcriptional repressor